MISRVIIRVSPFRALITLLITYVLSPLPLQVGFSLSDLRLLGLSLKIKVMTHGALQVLDSRK